MKIMFLSLAAVLGLALGACSPSPAAQDSPVALLYAPAPALNNN
jgi:hypothetical protein